MDKKKAVIFYRASEIQCYLIIDDLEGTPNSVEIKFVKLSATTGVGSEIDRAFEVLSPYITEDYYTVYASNYIPNWECGISFWTPDKPSTIFKYDIYYSIFSHLHKLRGLTPTYILTGFSYVTIGVDLGKYFNGGMGFNYEYLNSLKHKPKTFTKICYDKPVAYEISKYIAKDSFKYISEHCETFPWLKYNLIHKIKTLGPKKLDAYKAMVSTIAWLEARLFFKKFAHDTTKCGSKEIYGFANVVYYHAQKLLEKLFDKPNRSEIEEVQLVELQEFLLMAFYNVDIKQYAEKALEWYKKHMPEHPVYLKRLSKYVTLKDLADMKGVEY